MSNQHTNPAPPDIYPEVLSRPMWRTRVETIDETITKNPEKCVVWPASNPSILQVRTEGGDRHHVHMRRLFWLYKFDTQPDFGPSTCGTRGCINPSHQRIHDGAVAIEPDEKPEPIYVGDKQDG